MNNQMNAKDVMIGAAIGGAVGCVAAYMLSSKNVRGLAGTCGEYGDKVKSILNEFSSSVSDSISEKSSYVADKAQDIIESVKDEIGEFPDLSNEDFRKGLIVGGVLGGLLGSGTTMLCSNGSCAEPSNWKAMAKKVLSAIETNGQSFKQKSTTDIFDLAVAGMQLWKKLQK